MAVLHDPDKIPKSIDWRDLGFITSHINQRDCGSCYAYSIALSIQGQIFKQKKMLLPLSAQQLIDCSTETGNKGCFGGSLRNTFKYLEKYKGLMAEAAYPYKAVVNVQLSLHDYPRSNYESFIDIRETEDF